MKRVVFAIMWAGVVFTFLLPAGSVFADEKADKQGLLKANADFYVALNAVFKGDPGPMEQVWSHSDDVNYMGPNGLRQYGWKAVSADWKTQADKRLGGTVTMNEPHIQTGDSIGVITGVEVGENIVDGQVQKVSIRTTSVFRKEGGTWKMIGHHTDKLPYLSN